MAFLNESDLRELGRREVERARIVGFDEWIAEARRQGSDFSPRAEAALRRHIEGKDNPGGECFDEGECHSFFPKVGPQTTLDIKPEFFDVDWSDVGYKWERGQRYRNSELTERVASRLAARMLKIAETAPEVLSGLNPRVVRKSQACSSRKLRMSPSILRYTFGVSCSPPSGSGTEHIVKMKVVPKTKRARFRISTADVKLSCSCPAWVWWGSEWHARTKKYLDQKLRGSGTPPDIRDPERQNMVCKHVYLVLQEIQDWVLTHPAHRRRR